MPRAFLKRHLPSPARLAERRALGIFGRRLADPELWHLNRRSASSAIGVGLFFAFFPLPLQMVFAAGAAIALRCNLPLSVVTVWITNPLTIPPLFFFTYKVGTWILGEPPRVDHIDLSWDWLVSEAGVIWQPLLVGSLLCGVLAGLTGWLTTAWVWRRQVIQRWERRRALRRLRADRGAGLDDAGPSV